MIFNLSSALLGFDFHQNKCPLKFPSTYDVKQRISRTFELHQSQICKEFESLDWICLTTDIWGNKHRSFLGVTAHGLDKLTFERKSFALSCTRFPHPHTGENIAEQIQLLYAMYKMSSKKIVAAIMDNAANFKKAFREHGSNHDEFSEFIENVENQDSIQIENFEVCDDEELSISVSDDTTIFPEVSACSVLPNRFPCSCHNFNLIGTKDIAEAKSDKVYTKLYVSSFQKLNKLWNKTSMSKSSETIRKHLDCSLKRPVKCRWNSVPTSVKEIIEKDPKLLDNLMTEFKITNFESAERLFLTEWVQILTPIMSALRNLEKTNCHFGTLLPTLFTVKNRLNEFLINDDIKFCKPLARAALIGLVKRFVAMDFGSKEAVPALLATCTHPHFKLRWLGARNTAENVEFIKQCLLKAAGEFVSNNTAQKDSNAKTYEKGNTKNLFELIS